jgi:hypothetical protein
LRVIRDLTAYDHVRVGHEVIVQVWVPKHQLDNGKRT